MTARRGKRGRGRKNRKRHEPKVGFPSPLAAILVAGAVLALLYLWFCGRCDALGKELGRLERKQEDLRGRLLNEEFKWTNMKSPRNMEHLLARHKLAMSLPAERDVVRVKAVSFDLAAQESPPASAGQYARKTGAYMND